MESKILPIALVTALALGAGGFYVAQQNALDQKNALSSAQSGETGSEPSAVIDQSNPKVINWEDLLPDGERIALPQDAATDFFESDIISDSSSSSSTIHSSETGTLLGPMASVPMPKAEARADMADKFVKLAGYMTPFNVEAGKTRSFLLVPYVGACIHVPAPPANQIVLVEAKEPIEVKEMWEPFEAIGTLRVETISTGLAEVGYTMDLARIEPFVYEDEKTDQTETN